MGDRKTVVVSATAMAGDLECQRSLSTLTTDTTSTLAAKTRCPPCLGSTDKLLEMLQLVVTRLRKILDEKRRTHRSKFQKRLTAFNYVEPLFKWWGANHQSLTAQYLGRVRACDVVGNSTELVDGASHHHTGLHSPSAYAEKLQRLCLDLLPVSDSDAVTFLRDELHHTIAKFLGADFCFTTSTGYGSNYTLLPALIDSSTVFIVDENCHNSIFAGILLESASNLRKFKHNDVEDLETLLSGFVNNPTTVIVAIEGLYRLVPKFFLRNRTNDGENSMEADLPPLDKLYDLKMKYGFVLYCDETHSFLSIGKTGRGCLEYWNDNHPQHPLPWGLIDIRTGTLSKAIGGVGGIIAVNAPFEKRIREHIDNLDERENVSLPSSTMAQTLWVLTQPLQIGRSLHRLAAVSRFCREELERFGIFVYGDISTPVLPIYAGRPSLSSKLCYSLRREGLLASPVCAPAVPFWESRVCINLSADFTDEEVNSLIRAVIRAAERVGICKIADVVPSHFKTDEGLTLVEEHSNEASKAFELIQNLIKMDALLGRTSTQKRLFNRTCGPRILQIGHQSRVQYGIGAGGTRWICDTFPPHIAVEDLIARATGMEAGLTYADVSIGLASTIAAISRPVLGHTKHYMIVERGAVQFVHYGPTMPSKKDAPILIGYVDLFQLVQQARKLYRRNDKLHLTVCVRVGEDSAHHLLSSILEEIAALTGPESVMTILLHCTSHYLDPRELISFPSRENIHVLVCGSFSRIFGLPAGFLTGSERLIQELRDKMDGYVFTTSPPPFIMEMLRAALEWNLSTD